MVTLFNLNYAFLVLVLISFIINYKKFSYNQSKLYFVAFFLLFVTEVIANIQFYYFHQKNILTYQIGFDFIYSLIVLFFYYQLLQKKNFILFLILIYAVFNIFYITYHSIGSTSLDELNDKLLFNYKYSYLFNAAIFLIVFMQYIYETFSSDTLIYLKYYFPAWITASLLINVVAHIPIYVSLKIMIENQDIFSFFNPFINIISYTFLIIGIFLNKNIKTKTMT